MRHKASNSHDTHRKPAQKEARLQERSRACLAKSPVFGVQLSVPDRVISLQIEGAAIRINIARIPTDLVAGATGPQR